MRVHDVKEWPATFGELIEGSRNVEVRFNDREYRIDDVLKIREWDPRTEDYTGRQVARRVEAVHESTRLTPGFVILEIKCMDDRWELTDEGKKVAQAAENWEGREEESFELDGAPATAPRPSVMAGIMGR